MISEIKFVREEELFCRSLQYHKAKNLPEMNRKGLSAFGNPYTTQFERKPGRRGGYCSDLGFVWELNQPIQHLVTAKNLIEIYYNVRHYLRSS